MPRGVLFGEQTMTNSRFADDTTLLAASIEEMENLLSILGATSLTYALVMNRFKTKTIVIDSPNNNIQI